MVSSLQEAPKISKEIKNAPKCIVELLYKYAEIFKNTGEVPNVSRTP